MINSSQIDNAKIGHFLSTNEEYVSKISAKDTDNLRINKKSDERKYKCQLCSKDYLRSDHLKRHMLNSHKEDEVKWEDENFLNHHHEENGKSELEDNNPWDVDSLYSFQFFNCPSCLYKFYSKQEFIDHAFISHPESIFHLKNIKDDSVDDIYCPWDTSSRKIKSDHLDMIKLEEDNGDLNTYEENSNTIETFSTYRYKSESSDSNVDPDGNIDRFEDENITERGENNNTNNEETFESSKLNQCDICTKKFKTVTHLKRHIMRVHEGIKKFQCDSCGKKFVEKKDLTKHVLCVHENIRNFLCDKCDRHFATNDQLKRHFKFVHEGLRPHSCEHAGCNKSFARPKELKYHIMAVHEQVRLKCDECEKKFSNPNSLQVHINTCHKGQRAICQYCSKEVSYLKGHIAQHHEQEKKFSCNKCEKSFQSKYLLRRHSEVVHEGLKNYKCDKCSKTFSDAGNMRKHIACVHENLKPYQCDDCGKAYGQSNDLRRHIKKFHFS